MVKGAQSRATQTYSHTIQFLCSLDKLSLTFPPYSQRQVFLDE